MTVISGGEDDMKGLVICFDTQRDAEHLQAQARTAEAPQRGAI